MTASEQAVNAVADLAQKTYDQSELLADLASGIVDSAIVNRDGAPVVVVTVELTRQAALRLQHATGVALVP